MAKDKHETAAFSAGGFLLLLCIALGVGGGLAFPAANDPSATSWVVIVKSGGTFNWGVFILCALAGVVCFTVGVVGQAVIDALRSRD